VADLKELQLLWVYSSRMRPGYSVKAHSHDDYFQMLSIIEGELVFNLEGKEYILTPCCTVIIPKNYSHFHKNDSTEPAVFYELKFTVLNQPLSHSLCQIENHVFCDSFSADLVRRIADEYLKGRAMKQDAAAAMLLALLYHMNTDVRLDGADKPSVIDTTGFTPLSKKVVELLTERYAEDLTLDDISKGVNTTKNYLCNAFKRNTGVTIIDCLNMIRIRKAAELIVYSDLPLAQVAQMCGYVSPSHFNRVFMRYVGIPPGQCRRAYSYDVMSKKENYERLAGSFMYSVLADKSLSADLINSFERQKLRKEGPEQ